MGKQDKIDVIIAAITAILWGFIAMVVVAIILSAMGRLPESWGF